MNNARKLMKEDTQSEKEDEPESFSKFFIHENVSEYENESSNTEEDEILIPISSRKRTRSISDSEDKEKRNK